MNIATGFLSRQCIGFAAMILLTTLIVPFLCCDQAAASSPAPLIGGPCAYKSYKGEAEIVSVSPKQDRSGTYEIKFSFHPQDIIQEEFAGVKGRQWFLALKDSSSLSKDFLTRHGIQTGKRLPCTMKVITKGTCTPILFDFPTLDPTHIP